MGCTRSQNTEYRRSTKAMHFQILLLQPETDAVNFFLCGIFAFKNSSKAGRRNKIPRRREGGTEFELSVNFSLCVKGSLTCLSFKIIARESWPRKVACGLRSEHAWKPPSNTCGDGHSEQMNRLVTLYLGIQVPVWYWSGLKRLPGGFVILFRTVRRHVLGRWDPRHRLSLDVLRSFEGWLLEDVHRAVVLLHIQVVCILEAGSERLLLVSGLSCLYLVRRSFIRQTRVENKHLQFLSTCSQHRNLQFHRGCDSHR